MFRLKSYERAVLHSTAQHVLRYTDSCKGRFLLFFTLLAISSDHGPSLHARGQLLALFFILQTW